MIFQEKEHKYFKNNSELISGKSPFISASTVVDKFSQDFDDLYWSLYKAYEFLICRNLGVNLNDKDAMKAAFRPYRAGIPIGDYALFDHLRMYADEEEAADIKHQFSKYWKEGNEESKIKGTNYHNTKEQESYDRGYEINPWNSSMFPIQEHYKIENGLKFRTVDLNNLEPGFYAELIVDHDIFCGQIDKLYVNHKRQFWIDDYKTNKKIKTSNTFQRMKRPIEHIEDCNYNHYRLQIGLYAWMLINHGYECMGLRFTHFEEPYIFEYMESEVRALTSWLQFENL